MNPYTKAAQFVIRLAGFGVVAVSVILLLGNVVLILSDRPPERALVVTLESFCFAFGCVILWKSTSLAERLTGELDDNGELEDSDESESGE